MTRSRSGVRPCVASHMFRIFLRYPPNPQSRCPCNCQVMFRLWLLLYCHYSCSEFNATANSGHRLGSISKKGPTFDTLYTSSFHQGVHFKTVFLCFYTVLFFCQIKAGWDTGDSLFFLPNLISITSPCSYQIFPSRLAPRGRPTFTTQCRLNNTDLFAFMVIFCPDLPISQQSPFR